MVSISHVGVFFLYLNLRVKNIAYSESYFQVKFLERIPWRQKCNFNAIILMKIVFLGIIWQKSLIILKFHGEKMGFDGIIMRYNLCKNVPL